MPNFGRIDAFATFSGKGIFTLRRPSLRLVPPSSIITAGM
jgi:hypothetical protein